MDGQKTAQDQLNDALGDLGQDMLDRTGGDVWRSGQPLATEPQRLTAAETPSTESTSEEATPEADAPVEPTSAPEPKLILGKYKTEDDALRGYHEAVAMGNAAKAEADALRAQLHRPTPAAPEPEIDPLEELESFGVPKEVMQRVITSQVSNGVEAKLKEMFAPAIQQAQDGQRRTQADQEIIVKYPEYQARFNDLVQFVDANEDVRNAVVEAEKAGQFGLAREFAWLRFTSSNVQKVEEDLKAQGKARESEIRAVRHDAGVRPNTRSEGRTKPVEDRLSNEEFEKLKDLAKAGHPTPLYRETIGRTLPKDFDNLFGG